MALQKKTFRETIAQLTVEEGLRDYVTQFVSLNYPSDEGEPLTEAAFFRQASTPPDTRTEELERLRKRTNPMIRDALRTFALIALPPDKQNGMRGLPGAALKAYHVSLFSLLYQAGANLRSMLEVSLDGEDVDDYVKRLRSSHGLDPIEAEAFTMDWVDHKGAIAEGLLHQNMLLMMFGPDEAPGFMLRTPDGQPALQAPAFMQSPNGVIASKEFFLIQILTILKHAQLMTLALSLDRGIPYSEDEVEILDLPEMTLFAETAEKFMDRTT